MSETTEPEALDSPYDETDGPIVQDDEVTR